LYTHREHCTCTLPIVHLKGALHLHCESTPTCSTLYETLYITESADILWTAVLSTLCIVKCTQYSVHSEMCTVLSLHCPRRNVHCVQGELRTAVLVNSMNKIQIKMNQSTVHMVICTDCIIE